MNYHDNEQQLMQLLQKLQYVAGTYPPVYMLDGVLIGYDKLGHLKILGVPPGDPTNTEEGWTKRLEALREIVTKAGLKLAEMGGYYQPILPPKASKSSSS